MDDGSLIWHAGKRAREAAMAPAAPSDGGAAVWNAGKAARERFAASPAPAAAVAAKPAVPWESPGNLGGVSAIPFPGFSRNPGQQPIVLKRDQVGGLRIDPATGKVQGVAQPGEMKPASSFLGGVKRVYDEAGGGLTGAGAVARDAGGSAVLGAGTLLSAPILGVKKAGEAIGSGVADFAAGWVGDTQPAAAPAPAAPKPAALPATATDSDPRAASAGTAPSAAPAQAPIENRVSTIQVARGGGYSGTPGFTASEGMIGTGADLSAARRAAADRGDTDALAASYQANGGTFLGRTAAQDQTAALNKAAAMSPRGSRAEKSFLAQAAAVAGQEGARRTLDLAETKQAGDQALQAAQIGQAEATTAGLQQQNLTRQQQMAMLKEIADLDPAKDPDGSIRQGKIDAYLATVHGKDIEPKYTPIDIPTGNFNLATGQEQFQKGAVVNRTGKIITGERKTGAVPPGMKVVGTSGGKPVYEDAKGKRFIGD